jgi:hypothetical protein
MIKVENVAGKGRGIIATTSIVRGTSIEWAPVAPFQARQWQWINKTDIFKYCFAHPQNYNADKDTDGYIVFGLSSLCNHSTNPNAYINWVQRETGLWVNLIALSSIQAEEEVSISYTNIDRYSCASNFV